MSSRDEVQVWAEIEINDPIFSNPQRDTIEPDYWAKGWLRDVPVAAQELNQLFYLITDILKNDTLSPALNLSDVDDVAAARTNLGIILTDYLRKDQNLADVPNKATARANLELNTTLFNEFFDKIYPVGTIYENKTNSANPNTYLGRGTWVAEGQGRVLVGAGSSSNDINGNSRTFAAGVGGSFTHSLTPAQLAPHTHEYRDRYYPENEASLGVTAPNKEALPIDYNNNKGSSDTDIDNTHVLYLDSITGSTGYGDAFDIMQPHLVVYRWVRVS